MLATIDPRLQIAEDLVEDSLVTALLTDFNYVPAVGLVQMHPVTEWSMVEPLAKSKLIASIALWPSAVVLGLKTSELLLTTLGTRPLFEIPNELAIGALVAAGISLAVDNAIYFFMKNVKAIENRTRRFEDFKKHPILATGTLLDDYGVAIAAKTSLQASIESLEGILPDIKAGNTDFQRPPVFLSEADRKLVGWDAFAEEPEWTVYGVESMIILLRECTIMQAEKVIELEDKADLQGFGNCLRAARPQLEALIKKGAQLVKQAPRH
ncbi:MAG: hypothetical protein AB7G06_06080 [Bdellovibrionales bacterium]